MFSYPFWIQFRCGLLNLRESMVLFYFLSLFFFHLLLLLFSFVNWIACKNTTDGWMEINTSSVWTFYLFILRVRERLCWCVCVCALVCWFVGLLCSARAQSIKHNTQYTTHCVHIVHISHIVKCPVPYYHLIKRKWRLGVFYTVVQIIITHTPKCIKLQLEIICNIVVER